MWKQRFLDLDSLSLRLDIEALIELKVKFLVSQCRCKTGPISKIGAKISEIS